MKSNHIIHIICYLFFIALFMIMAMENIASNPVLIDEYAHIPAGVSHWQLGRHNLYRENPPLVRMISSFPVWLSHPKNDYSRSATSYRSEWAVGEDFIKANGARYPLLVAKARSVVILMGVVCGLLIFIWTKDTQSTAAAVVAASIWLLDPSVIANSSIATIDIGTTLFGFVATFAFWKFLQNPGRYQTIVAGIALGCAQACKFSMLILYPAFILIIIISSFLSIDEKMISSKKSLIKFKNLLIVMLISLITLNFIYGFDRFGKPIGYFTFKSRLLSGIPTESADRPAQGNRLRGTWIESIPVPLPEDYVKGFDSQKWDEEFGFYRIVHGRLIHRGEWYSPIVTLIYKLPLGTLALLAASILYWITIARRFRLIESLSAVTALSILALLGTQTGLNWAIRYALPAIPFIALGIGGFVNAVWKYRLMKVFVVACLVWNLSVLLGVHPHFQSYGNPIVGGIDGARNELCGSNLDWGQDLFRLKQWQIDHPDADLAVLYYGAISPTTISIETKPLPDRFLRSNESYISDIESPALRKPFYLAISAALLQGIPADLRFESGLPAHVFIKSKYLKFEKSIDRIGDTIYLFHIVPNPSDAKSMRSISYDDLKGSLIEATDDERRTYTVL